MVTVHGRKKETSQQTCNIGDIATFHLNGQLVEHFHSCAKI